HVALARRLENRGIGAHEHGEIVLHLAFAREAPPDAHALAWRRRIDIEPGLGHELCDRIDVRHVDPVGAAIIRHPECLGVGDASTAHFRGRLDDRDPPAAPRRRPAAMPAAPAPPMIASGLPSGRGCREPVCASAGAAVTAADAARNVRRLTRFMTGRMAWDNDRWRWVSEITLPQAGLR